MTSDDLYDTVIALMEHVRDEYDNDPDDNKWTEANYYINEVRHFKPQLQDEDMPGTCWELLDYYIDKILEYQHDQEGFANEVGNKFIIMLNENRKDIIHSCSIGEDEPPYFLYHGTCLSRLNSILENGILRATPENRIWTGYDTIGAISLASTEQAARLFAMMCAEAKTERGGVFFTVDTSIGNVVYTRSHMIDEMGYREWNTKQDIPLDAIKFYTIITDETGAIVNETIQL